MKQIKTLAIVLRRTDYGEADKIVNFLTPKGRIAALAKGVRKQKSKMAGGIEVFSVNEIVVMDGKRDLKTLISARSKEFFSQIVRDYDRTETAYWAIKQVGRASEIVDSVEFFEILRTVFMALDDFEIDESLIHAWTSLNLAVARGESLNFESDVMGERLRADARYDFDNFEKAFVERQQGRYDASHIKFLRLLVSSEPRILSKIVGGQKILSEIGEIVRVLGE